MFSLLAVEFILLEKNMEIMGAWIMDWHLKNSGLISSRG
jgi:hypothetical protein